MTVYGKGGQTRGYLNIKDTLSCVRLALENPPSAGELRILNQFTETFSVNDLAERVRQAVSRCNLDVTIKHVDNPRKEAEEHYYNPKHTGLLELGLKPNYLTEDVLVEMLETALKYRNQIRTDQISLGVKWE